jgi:hypothetical protein
MGAALYFIGHGAAGITSRDSWPIASPTAVAEMCIGVLALSRPAPAVLLAMTLWTLQTASAGAIGGSSGWASLAQTGSAGVALALLSSAGWPRSLRQWIAPVRPVPLDARALRRTAGTLRVTAAALLIGHGGAGALALEPALGSSFAAMGMAPGAVEWLALGSAPGWFEIGLGLVILAWPWRGFLLLACAGMLGAEGVRALAGAPPWEHVESGASHAAFLALLWLRGSLASLGKCREARARHRHRLRALVGITRPEDDLDPRDILA